jgi:hypothetical protein
MPRDLWKKDKDREHSRRASREYAEHGRLMSYETVAIEHTPKDRIVAISAIPGPSETEQIENWLTKLHRTSTKTCRRLAGDALAVPPSRPDARAIPLLIFVVEHDGSMDNLMYVAMLARRIGPPAAKAICQLLREAKSDHPVRGQRRRGPKAICQLLREAKSEATRCNAVKVLGQITSTPILPCCTCAAPSTPYHHCR